ncbi:MAG: 4-hydroxythreonine-4-phosphate dehydrogenase PdxA [Psychromonas sp.]|nr:4-hydroxythreonine-4-phosphate dehydrogenase PdxA [Psychromonas sp.]
MLKRIIITSGEPAGIGPDLMLEIAQHDWPLQLVVCADKNLLNARFSSAQNKPTLIEFNDQLSATKSKRGTLTVTHIPLGASAVPGILNKKNTQYVLNTLKYACKGCLSGLFSAVVTAPVHKGIINDAGVAFSGHTEFFAEQSNTDLVVMMLATVGLRVALVTTHIALKDIPAAITKQRLTDIITILNAQLKQKYTISTPRIYVCGLNPHAGEGGRMGTEEINIIAPTLQKLRKQGFDLVGPLPADTIFQDKYLKEADVVLAMYHDQGLPTLKYKGFGKAVNITLGLPFIRTSVDHGTALDLAGTNKADPSSLHCAIDEAINMINRHN